MTPSSVIPKPRSGEESLRLLRKRNDELAVTKWGSFRAAKRRGISEIASQTKRRARNDHLKGEKLDCFARRTSEALSDKWGTKNEARSDLPQVITRGKAPEAIPELVSESRILLQWESHARTESTLFAFSPTKAAGFSTSGVTKGLQRRTYEHQGVSRDFAKRYSKAM